MNTPDELHRLRAAHAAYRQGVDVLDAVTLNALQGGNPHRVLDMGAGTGNWYHALRRLGVPGIAYVGVDPSSGMVDGLRRLIAGDPAARVVQSDADGFSVNEAFDWVGLHFVLPHVDNPPDVLARAWTLVAPGGLLLVAGNGDGHMAHWQAMHFEVLGSLGLAVGSWRAAVPRPTLDEIVRMMPGDSVLRQNVQGRFSFPDTASASAYYRTVLWRRGLGPDRVQDVGLRQAICDAMDRRIARIIQTEGAFSVPLCTGFAVSKRSERT